MLGLKRGTVVLLPHEKEWERQARQVIDLLCGVLGDAACDIQHVGSTAITHISAKPILDIAVGMKDPEQVFDFAEELEYHGVVFRARDTDRDGGILFVMGDFAADTRTCHIHVVVWQGEAWYNYINLRDYLNARPEQAVRYENCKRELAERYACDRGCYTEGKGPLIRLLLEQANRWRQGKEEELCE
ncbi:MAG: GrpB family protein [Ruminococcaceae bacterium]|nr:GrpB family protein [Oscillospiraceae bacterium]